jgi:hypothetical protein
LKMQGSCFECSECLVSSSLSTWNRFHRETFNYT